MSRRILKECLYEEQRAIVPSYGFDLRPVLAHCLKARRLRLLRDATLTLAIVAALLISWSSTLPALVVLALLAVASTALARFVRVPAIVNAALAPIGGAAILFIVLTGLSAAGNAGTELTGTEDLTAGGLGTQNTLGIDWERILGTCGFLFFLLAVPVCHRWLLLRTLVSLGPDSSAPAPQTHSTALEDRIEQVGAAQYGNVTLYSEQNPFIGSGGIKDKRTRVWSLVFELDRARPAQADRATLPVDPVELRKAVERKLTSMRDGLPAGEPVELLVDDHIVAEGECVQGHRPFDPKYPGLSVEGHPLIDPEVRRPFSKAAPAVVDLLVRNPQADVRCYQRITLEMNGAPVTDQGRRPVVPGREEGAQATAFLYLAVQGRMLYVQFVSNALPPIDKRFRVVDVLPSYTAGAILAETFRQTGADAPADALAGPFRLLSILREPGQALWRSGGADRWRLFTFDYGARVSVRELAAEPRFATFLQELDVNKYTRLIERRVVGALLDHLEHDRNIDVSAYRAQAASIISNSLIMNGGTVSGQIAFSPNGTVHQHAARS